jgi:hypothetical protein
MKWHRPYRDKARRRARGHWFRLAATLGGLLAAWTAASAQPLAWRAGDGVVWNTPWATVSVDRNQADQGPLLRFLPENRLARFDQPAIQRSNAAELVLLYETAGPAGQKITLTRRLEARSTAAQSELIETMDLTTSAPICQDVEIVRPFTFRGAALPDQAPPPRVTCTLPLKNGWAWTGEVAAQPVRGEFRLGRWLTGGETPELALPVVQVDADRKWQAGLYADPRFSSLFALQQGGEGVRGELRYRYAASVVPLQGTESRRFAFRLRPPPAPAENFGGVIDAFFRLMLPEVPPGPAWLHDICMVGYDYLSDGGLGWDRDVDTLAQQLSPAERQHVALCFHGWYDYLGAYCYDEGTGRLKDAWVAMPRTRKVALTKEGVRSRLGRARSLGFRVLWYFGDGLVQDSGAPGYHADWNLLDEKGQPVRTCWQGPDTLDKTYPRNPAHPGVAAWCQGYLAALLRDYGPVVDGFVWDETFLIRSGDLARAPEPAYAARAMLDLVKRLTLSVDAVDPEKVFLASDDVGLGGTSDTVGYAMVADGNYQDSWCEPSAWSYALFPNWRNCSWSCNWNAVTRFHWTRWGVENFGVPVAISNGWEDDRGPFEWTPAQRDTILALFRKRLAQGPARVRYLTQDPARLLADSGPDLPAPAEPVPTPGAAELNWALAARGSRATASSESHHGGGRWPALGVIDGSRSTEKWGAGHGWASADDAALPQWVQVEFPEPRSVSCFVVFGFQAPKESARKWGVTDYTVDAWDDGAARWRTVAQAAGSRVMATRVHTLERPVTTKKFRLVISRVAPLDGVARLLQVEAWGPR